MTMQTTSCTNPFNSLRVEDYSDADVCREFQTVCITHSRNEVINILVAEAEPGKWVHGYSVFWANGRTSTLHPSLSNGYFHSERDAKLFVLGFMSQYLPFFDPESAEAIKNNIKELSQNSLF